MRFANLILMLSAVSLVSCGSPIQRPDLSQRELSFLGHSLLFLDAEDLILSSTLIEGTGAFVVNQPLASVDSEAHFKLAGQLPEGSFIELIVFSTSQLEGGVSFKFERRNNLVALTISSGRRVLSYSDVIDAGADDSIAFSLDAHNQEQPIHFILWDGLRAGARLPDLIDSAEDDLSLGNGAGVFWGVRMQGAKVSQISRERAVKSHE